MPWLRLSWPIRQLLSARKYAMAHRIVSYRIVLTVDTEAGDISARRRTTPGGRCVVAQPGRIWSGISGDHGSGRRHHHHHHHYYNQHQRYCHRNHSVRTYRVTQKNKNQKLSCISVGNVAARVSCGGIFNHGSALGSFYDFWRFINIHTYIFIYLSTTEQCVCMCV